MGGSKIAFALAVGMVLAVPRVAAAFCRTTACDAKKESCPRDPGTGCMTHGAPLGWASGCVDIYVQEDGAPSQGIAWQDAQASLQRALDTWLETDCDGAPPSLKVNVRGSVACRTAEYNSQGHNANILMFRESDWPYPDAVDAIGYSHVLFELGGNGDIWDGDIELNAFDFEFSLDGSSGDDLDSVLTHEVGHWLGLDHTRDMDATMFAEYGGGTGFRSLAADDKAGICALYPPGRTPASESCEPRHGFSAQCLGEQEPDPRGQAEPGAAGCSFTPSTVTAPCTSAPALTLALLVLGALWRRVPRARCARKKHDV